jgi:NADH-quinone oxidoreductase subunit J
MLDSVLFYLFAAVAIIAAGLMISRRNLIHAAFYLITTLLAIGGIFLQLRADVLFGMQIVVYAGGIMLLFLCVIYLTRSDTVIRQARFGLKKKLALMIVGCLGLELLVVLSFARKLPGEGLLVSGSVPADKLPPNAFAMATSLFGDYLLPFEMASVLFLVAMVGAVVMVKNSRRSEGS